MKSLTISLIALVLANPLPSLAMDSENLPEATEKRWLLSKALTYQLNNLSAQEKEKNIVMAKMATLREVEKVAPAWFVEQIPAPLLVHIAIGPDDDPEKLFSKYMQTGFLIRDLGKDLPIIKRLDPFAQWSSFYNESDQHLVVALCFIEADLVLQGIEKNLTWYGAADHYLSRAQVNYWIAIQLHESGVDSDQIKTYADKALDFANLASRVLRNFKSSFIDGLSQDTIDNLKAVILGRGQKIDNKEEIATLIFDEKVSEIAKGVFRILHRQ